MSEQEFWPVPQSQGWQFAENDQRNTQYAARAFVQQAQVNGKALPKDEPSSNYDEPMTQSNGISDYTHGYTAQTYTTYNNQPSESGTPNGKASAGQQQNRNYRYSPDGDAYENHYRPYGPYSANYRQNRQYQQWNVPAWARPQQHSRNGWSILCFIILGLIFIGPLMHLLGVLFAVIGVLFLLVFVPLILFLVIGLPLMIMRAVSGPFTGVGWRRNSFWMGYRPRRRSIWW